MVFGVEISFYEVSIMTFRASTRVFEVSTVVFGVEIFFYEVSSSVLRVKTLVFGMEISKLGAAILLLTIAGLNPACTRRRKVTWDEEVWASIQK
jgi:hypothetical protein